MTHKYDSYWVIQYLFFSSILMCLGFISVALESHLWQGWGRQNSGRLRKREKWGTWKERNRNPPGLPNLPFSEKEKKKEFGIKRKQNFYEQTKWAIVVVQRQDLRNTFTLFYVQKNPNFHKRNINFFKSVIWLPTDRHDWHFVTIVWFVFQ